MKNVKHLPLFQFFSQRYQADDVTEETFYDEKNLGKRDHTNERGTIAINKTDVFIP